MNDPVAKLTRTVRVRLDRRLVTMKTKNEERKRQRILARVTAQEFSAEELKLVRGTDDNQDPGCGCGPSTALATTPLGVEDA